MSHKKERWLSKESSGDYLQSQREKATPDKRTKDNDNSDYRERNVGIFNPGELAERGDHIAFYLKAFGDST